MTDMNMKSELLGAGRCKVEIRSSSLPQRWRMSKTPFLSNGDHSADECDYDSCSEVNMVAAMQDHLSCTKTGDILKLHESKENKVTLPYELDHMYANCSDNRTSKDESQQIKCMKEWLILNLDLIQQQQEQLTLKEQQYNALRRENEGLKQRVEVAEERLAALQKENDKIKQEHTPSSRGKNSAHIRNGRRLKSISVSKDLRSGSAESHSKQVPASNDNEKASSIIEDAIEDVESKAYPKKDSACQKKDDIMQTEILYYTHVGEVMRTSTPPEHEHVLVPQWRLRPISSCYQLEGTENLEDEIFLKRHQKLEIDEKRRKRWDMQRLREQRLHDKLKRGRCGTKELFRNHSPDLATFYPTLEDALSIEVSNTVPVSAFGHTVPKLESSEFRIPWLKIPDPNAELLGNDSSTCIRTRHGSDSKSGT